MFYLESALMNPLIDDVDSKTMNASTWSYTPGYMFDFVKVSPLK